jgi:hypothetical protein
LSAQMDKKTAFQMRAAAAVATEQGRRRASDGKLLAPDKRTEAHFHPLVFAMPQALRASPQRRRVWRAAAARRQAAWM